MRQTVGRLIGAAALLSLAACSVFDSPAPAAPTNTPQTAMITFPGQLEPAKVTYQVKDGWAIMDGDIILGKAEEIAQTLSPQGYGLYGKRNLWPSGRVPYSIGAGVSDLGRQQVREAVRHWTDKTDLTFVKRTTEAAYIEFTPGDAYGQCYSFLGASQDRQPIWLYPDGECPVPTLIHELGHAVGLAHEHNRADRDAYIDVREENIEPDALNQFQPQDGMVEYGPYDYFSVMHYHAYAYSKNGEPTIVPKNGVSIYEIGYASGLSAGDVRAVKELYAPKPGLALSTKFDDAASAVGSNGEYVYVLSRRDVGGGVIDNTVFTLERFDRSGRVVWAKEELIDCHADPCTYRLTIPGVDAQGNVYVAVTAITPSGLEKTRLLRYDRSGGVGSDGHFDADSGMTKLAFAVAPNLDQFRAFVSTHDGKAYLSKTPEDWLRPGFTRPLGVGVPKSLALSPSGGDAFIAGSTGLSRYTSGGQLIWTKPGSFHEVATTGTYVYARYLTTVYKFDLSGKQLWAKAQGGLSGPVVSAMARDTAGNLYLSGKTSASSSDRNAFVRKLAPDGGAAWTKTYGTSAYDDAIHLSTVTGSEIYVTGATKGALAHPNLGGTDGYLRRLDGSGNPVWTR